MRYFLASLLLIWTSAFAAPATVESVPDPRQLNGSHVSDPDNIIGTEAAARINHLLISLEQDKGVQVAVVAVYSIGSENVLSFAQALFEHWGIGDQKRDDGLLVLLVKNQNSIRMHTGYGLEGSLPDVVCSRIERRYMVPAFKEGRYSDGLIAGLNAVVTILTDSANAESLAVVPQADDSWFGFKLVVSIGGGIALFLVFIFKVIKDDFSANSAQKRHSHSHALDGTLLASELCRRTGIDCCRHRLHAPGLSDSCLLRRVVQLFHARCRDSGMATPSHSRRHDWERQAS